MRFFDSHAHLSASEFAPDIDEVVHRAKKADVNQIINICTDLDTLKSGLDLARRHAMIANAGATTPHDVEKEGDLYFSQFEQAARDGLLAAIGETGLDYHYEYSDRTLQKKFLVRYLHLAAELKLPVIFHCREAFEDLFAIVDAEYPKNGVAILHCFTGDMKEAEAVWKRGWYLSLSGIVTFKKSEALRQVAKEAPIEQLLIETDAPYLAPQSHRGVRNEPAYISETAACIANVKQLSTAEIAEATYTNGMKLFQLSN